MITQIEVEYIFRLGKAIIAFRHLALEMLHNHVICWDRGVQTTTTIGCCCKWIMMRLNGSVLFAAGDVSDGYNTDFRSDAKGKFGRTLFKLSVLGDDKWWCYRTTRFTTQLKIFPFRFCGNIWYFFTSRITTQSADNIHRCTRGTSFAWRSRPCRPWASSSAKETAVDLHFRLWKTSWQLAFFSPFPCTVATTTKMELIKHFFESRSIHTPLN